MKKKNVVISFTVFIITLIIGCLVIAIWAFKWELPLDFLKDLVGIDKITLKERLQSSETWVFNINFAGNDDLEKIASSNYDLVVVDISDVDNDGISKIKENDDKLVLCYISIGQAESYREYWKEGWETDKPEWVTAEDQDWPENYNIKFWSDEWEDIIFGSSESYIDLIIQEGFDGVYLDTAGVDYWIGEENGEAEGDMVQLIKEISDYARGKNKEFLIVPQNLGLMKDDYSQELKDKIDGVAQEEVFYGYENNDGVGTPVSVSRSIVNKLENYQKLGLPIFVVDYPFKCPSTSSGQVPSADSKGEEQEVTASCYDRENLIRMRDSYAKGWEHGYIMCNQNRDVSGVTYSVPLITKTKVEYDNLPILSWDIVSGNSKIGQSTFRIFVSSTHEKLVNDDPDIYDSGKRWGTNTSFGFIPDRDIESGEYFWKVIVYEQIGDVSLVSSWSKVSEFEYEKLSYLLDESDGYESSEYQTAWLPNWGFEAGFDSLKRSRSQFDSISPVWFEVNEDGTLQHGIYYNNEEFINFCSENDIKIIPSIPLFDPGILSKVLNENLDNHVEAVYNEVVDGGYNGIDLDYESTYLKDKELLFEFLRKLSKRLHKKDKVLSFTVLPKWTDKEIYAWLPETRQVQDWKELSKIVDEIRIMAYDYTSQNSYLPGPMSPIYWEDLVLKYAVERIPKEKVVLALPLYGYSFRVDEKTEISKDIFTGGEIAGGQRRVLAYTFEDIEAVGQDFEFEVSYDEFSQEQIIKYNDGRYDRVLYFEDHEAIKMRRNLAGKYEIKGVAYWRLGGDDEKSFE